MATLASSNGLRTAFGSAPSTTSSALPTTSSEPNIGAGSSGGRTDQDMLTVVWGGEKYRLPLPPPDAPLSTLRKAIYERTGVPPEHQKLILNGAMMQKDFPLKAYGLALPPLGDSEDSYSSDPNRIPSSSLRGLLSKWGLGNSPVAGKRSRELKVTLIGSAQTGSRVTDHLAQAGSASGSGSARQKQTAAQQPIDEARIVAQIDSLVSSTLSRLKPDLDQLFSLPLEEATLLKRKQVYLSEMLLQTLLKLDGFEIDSRWTDARKARKEGIRSIQGMLDRVDAIKEGRAMAPPTSEP